MLDLARLSLRDDPDTQTDYNKHIEGSAAHYSAWAELPCIEVVPTHLRNIQWTETDTEQSHIKKTQKKSKQFMHVFKNVRKEKKKTHLQLKTHFFFLWSDMLKAYHG